LVVEAHGQGNALALDVDLEHFHFHDLTGFDDAVRVFDKLLGKRRDVYQAVLMHANVDKRAECSHVSDDALEDHPRL
jgi:hypothetical protein